uniref:Uncharacterized protein n=1 Tax=Moniliophthora roreri TaxID=221103 RepID=A0A0W0FHY0_MONRR
MIKSVHNGWAVFQVRLHRSPQPSR